MPIRTPTPEDHLFRWWRAALRGEWLEIDGEDPQPGFYRRRLVKGGPWVPVRIWMEQAIDPETGELTEPETLRCMVDLKDRDPFRHWTYAMTHPITAEAYDDMERAIRFARNSDPSSPLLHPTKPIDLSRSPRWPTTR